MRKVFCDMCGEEITGRPALVHMTANYGGEDFEYNYELCTSCSYKVNKIIEGYEVQKELDSISPYQAGLLTKTRNALLRAKYESVGDIKDMSVKDLLAIRGMGNQGVRDVASMLSKHGIVIK